jgi:hypothetical protein
MAELFLEGNVEKAALSCQFSAVSLPTSVENETGVPTLRFLKGGIPRQSNAWRPHTTPEATVALGIPPIVMPIESNMDAKFGARPAGCEGAI